MNISKFNKQRVIRSWIESSDKDFKTMNHLFKSRDYAWSLFVGHLVIEKLLKACYVLKIGELPPFTHNLLKLTEKTNLKISLERKVLLDTITTFNLNTRYDSEKQEFYKKCSKEFTEHWTKEIKIL